MGNTPRLTGKVVRFRSIITELMIEAPTDGAAEDWEREVKRNIQRTVNNQALARRHGVKVRPPSTLPKQYPDAAFTVYFTALPISRRGPGRGR